MLFSVQTLLVICTFTLGTIAASFLNVVAKSVPIQQNWWSRRSACPHCQTTLTALQLIPVFSFLAQKGRCRTCQTKIPLLYLLAEILGGFLFIIPLIRHPYSPSSLIQAWIFLSLLLTVTLTDFYYRLIPNKILIAFGFLLLPLQPYIATAIIGFLFFYATAWFGKILFKKETLGGGDIKLYLVVGLALPIHSLFLSIAISSAIALVYAFIFARNKPIPFAPFISLGSLIAYLM